MSLEPRLAPPHTKPNLSVARMTGFWYVACESRQLVTRKPKALTLLGIPMVVFRNASGQAGALLDRCPHRNVPLSGGKVKGPTLQCPYHGWEFDTDGRCRHIPGLTSPFDSEARGVTAFPVREQDGYVWVWPDAERAPDREPFRFPHLDDPRYTTARRVVEAQGTLHATIENALDVPHTAYLHAGLFRGTGKTNDITAVVRRFADRVEAEYVGEPRPEGLAARLLSPSGGTVTHFDRFFLPGVAQVEYAIGTETHFVVSSVCTPISDFHTRLYAVVSFRLRVPGWLVKPVLEPFGRWIFSQDASMLKKQTDNVKRFGGEQFQTTEIDVLGPHIWRLMKAAERGELASDEDEPFEKRVEMHV